MRRITLIFIALGIISTSVLFATTASAKCKIWVSTQYVEGAACEQHKKQAKAIAAKCKMYKTKVVPKLDFRHKPYAHKLSYSMFDQKDSSAFEWLTAAKIVNDAVSPSMLKTLKQCSDYKLVGSFDFDKVNNPYQQMKQQWKEVISDAIKAENTTMYLLKRAQRRNDPIGVRNLLGAEKASVALLIQLNARLTQFKQNDLALKQRLTQLTASHDKAVKNAEKQLRKIKCPRNKNKRLSRKIKSVVVSHFDNGKKPKDVRKVVVTGKPTKKRIRYKRLTHEDVPGYACFRAKTDDKWCGWFSITVRRTKFDGKKWGPYKQVFVGDVKQMSCANLK